MLRKDLLNGAVKELFRTVRTLRAWTMAANVFHEDTLFSVFMF